MRLALQNLLKWFETLTPDEVMDLRRMKQIARQQQQVIVNRIDWEKYREAHEVGTEAEVIDLNKTVAIGNLGDSSAQPPWNRKPPTAHQNTIAKNNNGTLRVSESSGHSMANPSIPSQ